MARSSRCSSGCHARYRKRHGARPAGIRKLATSSPPAHPYRRARPSDTGTLPSTPRLDHQRQSRSRTTRQEFCVRYPTHPRRIRQQRRRRGLAAGGTVTLTALMARELGGGQFAQWFAGLCIAAAGVLVGAGHLLSTTPFDILSWAGLLLLVLRILRTGNARLWLAVGVLVGAALLNKNTVFFLLFGLGVGLLATLQRRLLWSPWVVAGAVVAVAMWAPSLGWHADHGWAMFQMSRNLRREHSGVGVGIVFLPLQFLLMNPVTAPVWLSWLFHLSRAT